MTYKVSSETLNLCSLTLSDYMITKITTPGPELDADSNDLGIRCVQPAAVHVRAVNSADSVSEACLRSPHPVGKSISRLKSVDELAVSCCYFRKYKQ